MKWLPWVIVVALLVTGGVGASCGRAALKASQARADAAIARAALDSAAAAQAHREKQAALVARDSARDEARTASAEAEALRRRNIAAETALPALPDTCGPALRLVGLLRKEADAHWKSAQKWEGVHVKDSLALEAAEREVVAQRSRGDGLNASLIDLRRESARDPDRWLFGIPRPRVVVGVGVQADPAGRLTSGVQITAGIPIF